MEDSIYDVAIIGAGPAGATAAIYTARSKLKTIVIDKSMLGGALALTSKIANYPGFGYKETISGREILNQMQEHARFFGAEFHQSMVFAADLEADPKSIVTGDKVIVARAVIIATGASSRQSKIAGEEEFVGRGVSYCATCDGPFFLDKAVAVVGSSDEAVEESIRLSRFAHTVHFVSPTAKLLADPARVEDLEAEPKIKIHLRYMPQLIAGDLNGVRSVNIASPAGDPTSLSVDGIFIYLPGNKPSVDYLGGVVQLSDEGFIVTDEDLQTSIAGVFAAGDVRGHRLKQVVVSAADGAIAAMAADKYVNKRQKLLSQR
ncbi:MAG: FAD-dependent oxidoreductase [Dehalococcoidia bacterium]|nr:FAD-dependent oxidoreductase [Dehalococcoidia bacterium]